MKLRKLLVAFGAVAVLTAGLSTTAFAAEQDVIVPTISANAAIGGGTAEPQADVIETKFRTTDDGILQYRRWNATHGYWVDPDWIDLPGSNRP